MKVVHENEVFESLNALRQQHYYMAGISCDQEHI